MRRPTNDMAEAKPDISEAAAVEAVVAVADRPWFDVADAPKDGTLIEYEPGKTARYRITRRRDTENRRWEVVGFWADPMTRELIPHRLEKWRLPDGYLTPGMVV